MTATTATLNGTVDPSGLEVSECRLEALPASETGFQRDEIQHLALSGATGGTFTLSFEGQTTAALPYDADAEEVEVALAALPAIGAGNVRAYAYEGLNVAFEGALAATDVPQLQADSSALTPAGASAEVTTTQQGEGWGNARVAACEPEAAAIPTDEGPRPVKASVSGLRPNAVEYTFRLIASNANGTETSYGSFLTAHTARTEAAEVTGAHSATLNGSIRPEGTQYEECFFSWGLASNPGYEHEAQCEPEASEISPGTEVQAVRAELEGLQEATEYRFRLVAENPEGRQEAEELTFETWGPPKLLALRASNATQSAATLEAEIDPSGFETSYRFEWGPSASYGNVVPASPESLGSGTTAVRADPAALRPRRRHHLPLPRGRRKQRRQDRKPRPDAGNPELLRSA